MLDTGKDSIDTTEKKQVMWEAHLKCTIVVKYRKMAYGNQRQMANTRTIGKETKTNGTKRTIENRYEKNSFQTIWMYI